MARDFKVFIRDAGMTHARTAPDEQQSSGQNERWHEMVEATTIWPTSPASLDDPDHIVDQCVRLYNERDLLSAIGDATPADKRAGRVQQSGPR